MLIAVFVPVSFFPGTTGRIYQQFALTIAFSIALSAFNALTLSPRSPRCLLRAHRRSRSARRSARSTAACTGRTTSYGSALGRCAAPPHARHRRVRRRPRADRVDVSRACRPASSPTRTRATSSSRCRARRARRSSTRSASRSRSRRILRSSPRSSTSSTSTGSRSPARDRTARSCSSALPAVRRAQGRRALRAGGARALRGPLMGLGGAIVDPVPAAVDPGRRRVRRLPVRDRGPRAAARPATLAGGDVRRSSARRARTPRLRGVLATFTVDDPQLEVDDRPRPREGARRLASTQIAEALQIYLGSTYVNDFDFGDRAVPRLRPGRRAVPRRPERASASLYVRSQRGALIALDELVHVDAHRPRRR